MEHRNTSAEHVTDSASQTCRCAIRGVSCHVHSCVYHDGDCFCTAEQISVGPANAVSRADTVCTTFRQKNR